MNQTAPVDRLRRFIERASDFPLLNTASMLWQRFLDDRLALTASSLTYTTVLALVPFFAVVLSIFTAFPAFAELEVALQQWLVESLIPASIAENVMGYLTQFAGKASRLGLLGFAGLTVTAISLMLTIDRTLNQIWRVDRPRPLSQRILIYWAALTLGPLVLGASLAITSFIVTTSHGWLPDLPGGVDFALASLQFLLMTGGVTLLYRFVPHTPVRWQHALIGAAFATICLALGREALGLYLSRIPTYSVIYGTFATVPILLLWIYVAWLIVLLGAVIAAYLPSLAVGAPRRPDGPGWEFRLATELLAALAQARAGPQRGLTRPELAQALQVDVLQFEPLLGALGELDWVGELDTRRENEEPRLVLLVEPGRTPVPPLVDRLLLATASMPDRHLLDRPLRDATLADLLAAQDSAPRAQA